MTAAQINDCPRCSTRLIAGYEEPHCIACGFVLYPPVPPTDPREAYEDRLRAAGARAKLVNPNGAKTECPAGHPYNETNTYVDRKGSRRCRACIAPTRTRRQRIAGLGAL